MSAHQAVFPVAVMARVLGMSEAGFHAWRRRPASAHAVVDAALLKRIRTLQGGWRQAVNGIGRRCLRQRHVRELLRHARMRTAGATQVHVQDRVKMACFSFIEGWYNPVRLHSALGYRSPMAYEVAMEAVTTEP